MSDNQYIPPPVTWRLPVFIEAPVEALKKNQVTCPTCPVFLQCQAGEGGTGWVCKTCRSTGVYVGKEQENEKAPPDFLIVDCGKHTFNEKSASEQMTVCALCSGNQMELELRFPDNRAHYLTTEYMTVPVETRQQFLKEKHEFWKEEYAKDAKDAR